MRRKTDASTFTGNLKCFLETLLLSEGLPSESWYWYLALAADVRFPPSAGLPVFFGDRTFLIVEAVPRAAAVAAPQPFYLKILRAGKAIAFRKFGADTLLRMHLNFGSKTAKTLPRKRCLFFPIQNQAVLAEWPRSCLRVALPEGGIV